MAEKSPGEAMVDRIIEDMAETAQLEPDQRDRELFSVIAEIVDEIEALKQVVVEEGRSVELRDGRMVVHGAVTEIRLQRAALAKLLGSLALNPTGKNPVKQRAAITRWAPHNAAKAALNGPP